MSCRISPVQFIISENYNKFVSHVHSPGCQLRLYKISTPAKVGPGEPISYTLMVENVSDVPALNLAVTDLIPERVLNPLSISEGGGLPTGQRYAEAERYYLSLLPRQSYALTDFVLQEAWQPVSGDPEREVVLAQWRDPAKAAEEVRDLVLMRRLGEPGPSRIYAGRLPPTLGVSEVPGLYRQRQWSEAQAKVEVSEHRLAQHQAAVANLRQQLLKLRQSLAQSRQALETALAVGQGEFLARQEAGQPLRRCQQRLAALYWETEELEEFSPRLQVLRSRIPEKMIQGVASGPTLSSIRQALRQAQDALRTSFGAKRRNPSDH